MIPTSQSTGGGPFLARASSEDKQTKKGSLLFRHTSQTLLKDEYLKLTLVDDTLSTNSLNSLWKRKLQNYANSINYPDELLEILKAGLYSRIENHCKTTQKQSPIPITGSSSFDQMLFIDLNRNPHFEKLFLYLFRIRLLEIKMIHETTAVTSVPLQFRTVASTEFREKIKTIADKVDFTEFMDEWESLKEKKKENYRLLKNCLGFRKDNHFRKHLRLWFERLGVFYSDLIHELPRFHQKAPSICGRIQKKAINPALIDKIPLADMRRTILAGNGRNLEITINKKEVLNQNGSYLQGLLHEIQLTKISTSSFDEADQIEINLMNDQESAPYSRILKLCSNNAWAQAELIIRESMPGFFQRPFLTKLQGLGCRITTHKKENYHVTQTRTLAIYKRRVVDDPYCITSEGNPICTIELLSRVHVKGNKIKVSVYIENWSINDSAELQYKWLVFRILSNHVDLKAVKSTSPWRHSTIVQSTKN